MMPVVGKVGVTQEVSAPGASAPAGSAPAGSAPAGSAPAASGAAGSVPAGAGGPEPVVPEPVVPGSVVAGSVVWLPPGRGSGAQTSSGSSINTMAASRKSSALPGPRASAMTGAPTPWPSGASRFLPVVGSCQVKPDGRTTGPPYSPRLVVSSLVSVSWKSVPEP